MEVPPSTTRAYLWMQTLGSPFVWAVNALLAVLLWGDLIASRFPETDEYFRYLAQVTDLPWHWKVIITLAVNVVLFVEVSFRAVRKREGQRDEYRTKLQLIDQARPHIVLRDPDAQYVEPMQIQAIGNVTNVVSFVRVRFVNKPVGPPLPNSFAHSVRAKVRFLEPTPEGKLLLTIEGKWADSAQSSTRDFRQHRNDLLKMDFGIEEEHSLDIAFRDEHTGEIYAFNNENYTYPQMKKPEHLLAGECFLIRISLLGPWVDQTYELLFSNDSSGAQVMRSLSLQ
jgi:hypothetical protein